jgi:catechol 2,3-dioxygenase-like lactoylglutathione lyase family enzyme
MNITGVDFITVPTRDFEQAEVFYGEVLELERSKRWGDMPAREFETGSLTIAVMQSDAFGVEFGAHSHPIALHVDDVHAGARSSSRKASSSRARRSIAASATWRTSPTPTATGSCCTTDTPRRISGRRPKRFCVAAGGF